MRVWALSKITVVHPLPAGHGEGSNPLSPHKRTSHFCVHPAPLHNFRPSSREKDESFCVGTVDLCRELFSISFFYNNNLCYLIATSKCNSFTPPKSQ